MIHCCSRVLSDALARCAFLAAWFACKGGNNTYPEKEYTHTGTRQHP